MPTKTGRQMIWARHLQVCKDARTADIQRATNFLLAAAEVRKGSAKQRRISRAKPTKAQKEIDKPITW